MSKLKNILKRLTGRTFALGVGLVRRGSLRIAIPEIAKLKLKGASREV
jgi:hypothetical protein